VVRFHDLFFNILGTSKIYTEKLQSCNELSNLGKVKEALLKDWDQVVGEVRDKIAEHLTNYKSVSSSIFILVMQVIINRLHKNINE
jgi:hypothetical protein